MAKTYSMGKSRTAYVNRDGSKTPHFSGRRDDPWVPNHPLVPDNVETWWHGVTSKPTAPAGEKKRKTLLDSLDILNAFKKGWQNSHR